MPLVISWFSLEQEGCNTRRRDPSFVRRDGGADQKREGQASATGAYLDLNL